MRVSNFITEITKNKDACDKQVIVTKTDGTKAEDTMHLTASSDEKSRILCFENSAVIVTVTESNMNMASDNLSKTFSDISLK